jgi:nucleotide-binding universal stress UspA family protein
MPNYGQDGPVVVAVGGNSDGRPVEWAAAEAAARGAALLIVHVLRPHWALDLSGLVPVGDCWSDRALAEDALQLAVRRARAVASDLEIRAQSVVGPPVALLTARSRGAQLLVLGGPSAGDQWRVGPLHTPVCTRVAGRASCPVVVVGHLLRGLSAGASPRVVVGVDDSGQGRAALTFAFRAAAQRGLGLTAVRVAGSDLPGHARLLLERVLAHGRDQFADVPVEAQAVGGDPARALIAASEGAALVVVGARTRGLRPGAPGSVGGAVVLRAHCPAVLVPPRSLIPTVGVRAGRREVAGADAPAAAPLERRRASWD